MAPGRCIAVAETYSGGQTGEVRRVLPWLATALLAAGAGTAAVAGALGLPRQSAAAWVTQMPSRFPSAWAARVLAATRASGTALLSSVTTEHLSYTSSTSSPSTSSTLYRAQTYDFRTSGAVDFTARRSEKDIALMSHRFEHEVQLGRTLFITAFPSAGVHLSHRRLHSPVGVLGEIADEMPYTPYDPLATPSATIEVKARGVGVVDGVDVWVYQLVGRSCGPATPLPIVDVWVDAQGRLVQIRTVLRATAPQSEEPAGYPPTPVEHMLLSETTTLHDFGDPVTIRPSLPPALFTASSGKPPPAPNSHCQN